MKVRWVVLVAVVAISISVTMTVVFINSHYGIGQVKGQYSNLYDLVECVLMYNGKHGALPPDVAAIRVVFNEDWSGRGDFDERYKNMTIKYLPISEDSKIPSFLIILEGSPFLKNATMVGYYSKSADNTKGSQLYVYARGADFIRK